MASATEKGPPHTGDQVSEAGLSIRNRTSLKSPLDPDLAALDNGLQAGELTLQEAAAGGMGRHLGLFSTTLLM
jgi:hypothetical protein